MVGFGYHPKLRMERRAERAKRLGYVDSTVYMNPIKHGLLESVTTFYVDNINIEGLDNVDHARELLVAGRRVVFLANHQSNSDTPILTSALHRTKNGDLAVKLVNLLGIRLKKLPVVKNFLNAYSYIPVWPPTEIPKNEGERKQASIMGSNATIAMDAVLAKGEILVFYPEATRSKDGVLQPVEDRMAMLLFGLGDIHIVPVSILNAKNILPKGKFIPKKGDATVKFGEPFRFRDIMAEGVGYKKKTIDEVMKKIAIMMPEELRGPYACELKPSVLTS